MEIENKKLRKNTEEDQKKKHMSKYKQQVKIEPPNKK